MLVNKEFAPDKIQSPMYYMWVTFKRNNISFTALWMVLFLLFITIFGNLLSLYVSSKHGIQENLLPPYWIEGGYSFHILGTDSIGQDLLSRLIKGIQLTLGGALITTLFIALLGITIGASGALIKGIKGSVLHHCLDVFLAIPTLLVAFIIACLFGASYQNCLLAVLLSLLPQFIREIYLCVESELNKQYIISLRLDGATNLRILRFGIIPNILEPLVTLVNRIFTLAVLEIATLGFLGFSSKAYDAELGALVSEGMDHIFTSPWLILFPGITLFCIVLIFNVFAEGLRHAIIEVEDE
jgi:cationic peptide transport system permease protein